MNKTVLTIIFSVLCLQAAQAAQKIEVAFSRVPE